MNTKLLLTAILPRVPVIASEPAGERGNLILSAISIAVFAFCFAIPATALAASNSVLDFDGTDDYVMADYDSVFDQADRLSISVWIQPDNTPGGDEYIVYRYNNYYLKINTSKQIVAGVYGGAWAVATSAAITSDGAEWTHIELTYDKDAGGVNELKLYIDGSLSGVGDYSTALTGSAEKIYIGAADTDGVGLDVEPISNFFDGKIDDVRLYQYARSLSDVQMDYNNGLAVRLGPSSVILSDSEGSPGCSVDPASCISHGLVASYDFNEGDGQTLYNAADTGSANDGTLGSSSASDSADPKWVSGGGSPTSASSGSLTSSAAGSALRFDGTNDYINCGSDSSLNITDAITVEAWVKVDDLTGVEAIALRYSTTQGKRSWQFRKSDQKLSIIFGDPADGSYEGISVTDSNIITSTETWYHAVVTYSLGTVVFYVNGISVASTDTSVPASLYSDLAISFEIGARGGDAFHFFNGAIDGVKIYNRALTAEEVRYHYNRGAPVAHWRMDEGEGSTLYDETSNNNDGTLHLGSSGNTATSTAWVSGNPSTSSGQASSAGSGSAIDFDGTDDYIDCGSIGNGKTISFWLNPDSIDESVFEEVDDTGVTIVSGTMTYPSWDNCYVNGIDTNTITTGWHHIVLTSTSNVTITAFRLGLVDATYFDGMIDDVKIYNYARTPAQILLDYNAGFSTHLK